MKKQFLRLICGTMMLLLLGCSAVHKEPVAETEIQTETTAVVQETLPVETEAEHLVELYELDMSEYDFTFDEVLLKIDWTDMVFTLKCFDGSVVTGTVEQIGTELICTHKDGKMILKKGVCNGKKGLHQTNYIRGTGCNYVDDQLMLCPQVDYSMDYSFLLAEDQEREITADPDVVPLDSYKHLYMEWFSFQSKVIDVDNQGQEILCTLRIFHYPLGEKWVFSTTGLTGAMEVNCEENPDGSVTFSHDGKEWNFHWEGDDLCFDGGSPLIGDNGSAIKENHKESEVPSGAIFANTYDNYVYDALYILPGKTLDECYAAIQIDTKNQWLKIQCWDGTVLQGPFTYGDEYTNNIVFPCEIADYGGTRSTTVMLIPSGHSLTVSNQWMLNIGPVQMGDNFHFFPVVGVDVE